MNFAAHLSHSLSSRWKAKKRESSNRQRCDHRVTRTRSEPAPQSSAPSFGENQIWIDLCRAGPSLTATVVLPAHRAEAWLEGPSVAVLQRANFLSAVGRQQISMVEVLLPLQFPFWSSRDTWEQSKRSSPNYCTLYSWKRGSCPVSEGDFTGFESLPNMVAVALM